MVRPGQEIVNTYEHTSLPGDKDRTHVRKHFATKTSAGAFYLETDAVLEQVAQGTRVTTTCRGESHGFFKLAEPLVVRLSKKLWEAAAENLRELLEDQAI